MAADPSLMFTKNALRYFTIVSLEPNPLHLGGNLSLTKRCHCPCFTFGEVDSFDRWDGKWALKRQLCVKRLIGISLTLIKGRGGFLMPFRRRMVQVVGALIEVQQSDIPRPEYVDEVHKKVVEGVKILFETHKQKYIDDYENVKLIINGIG